ncbi:MAG: hypothetical protein E7612_08935 [Ruminococcaceae bacterium]|nr:hypothetical protein [Oscillospiraceae bacterium]
MKNVKIPVALQFCFDDVGWDNGRDLRLRGQASRSGIPRRHAIEDYKMLHEFGKALGQKIWAPLCLADWDKDNLLRGQVGITHNPHGWDRKSEIDLEFCEEARDILNNSEYIELVIHGLLHGVYDENGKLLHEREYFKMIEVDGKQRMVISSNEDFNNRICLFFEIYNSWGFTKKIRSFVSPCGFGQADEWMIEDLAKRLQNLGVKYWANSGFKFDGPMGTYADVAVMKKGGSYNGKYGPMPPWEGYDLDPDLLMPFVHKDNYGGTNMVGMHWTNLLRLNPKRDFDLLPDWINYFNRERETFGTMIAKDVEFSVTQQFYNLYSKIDINDGKCIVDVSEACAKKTTPCKDEFYISFTKDIAPKSCAGGEISLYEEHKAFNTYKVVHTANKIEVSL